MHHTQSLLALMSLPATHWFPVCKVGDEIAAHGLPCVVEGHEIALFAVDGQRFATSNICTHQFAYLTDGYVQGDHVECPMHQGRFHIPTGVPVDGPVSDPLRTYPVRIEGDEVQVGLPGAAR